MEINYLAVLVAGIGAMIVGFVWYGVLFKKAWASVIGIDLNMPPEMAKRMQKRMGGAYFLQLVLSLITAGVLFYHIQNWAGNKTSLGIAFCVWFGFIMTTLASGAIWSGKPRNTAWKMFFITAGAQLLTFVIFALIFSAW